MISPSTLGVILLVLCIAILSLSAVALYLWAKVIVLPHINHWFRR